MQPNSNSVVISDPATEDQTIDGFVVELERTIGNSPESRGVRNAQVLSAKRLIRSEALKRRFGNFRTKPSKYAEYKNGPSPAVAGQTVHAVEIPLPAVTRLLDEISVAGEMVGFGIGIFVRLTVVSTATILVVGFFSIFVFMHGIGKGLLKTRVSQKALRNATQRAARLAG